MPQRGYQNLDEDRLADGYESFNPSVDFSQRSRAPLETSMTEGLSNDIFAASPSVPRAPQSHQVGETEEGRARKQWDHQDNLDQFFSRIYEYHQRGGFSCILLEEACELFIFVFIVSLSTFLIQCVNYPMLFAEEPSPENKGKTPGNWTKLRLVQALDGKCVSNFSFWIWVCLLVAFAFWLLRFLRSGFQLLHFWEIKNFYLSALKISTSDLGNLTWHEVLQCLCQVQQTEQLAIHTSELTELDIYQRILRHKNYMVAFVNRGLFPPRFSLPVASTIAYFPHGLKHNIEFLVFWGSWAPWKDYYTLKPEFKRRDQLLEASVRLERMTFWLGMANLLLSPLIFLWQILYWAFRIAELVKREPGALGRRNWSLYGQHYFRHFNELDHELKMRLNRAYRPAAQYQDLFVPKLGEILAKNTALVFGALFAVLAALSVWDEDVLRVEHVLTAMTVFGFIVYVCNLYIPDENLIWCPELLMKAILAQVHYLPDAWKGFAHTEKVRQEFSQLFQFKAFFFLEELLSPIVTPFVILFWLRPRIKKFAEFFHRFTVEVEGLGDVCSFAQMDVVKHGDRKWQGEEVEETTTNEDGSVPLRPAVLKSKKDKGNERTNNGKTEMSLLHFAVTNPNWNPPPESAKFLSNINRQAMRDADTIREHGAALTENPLLQSLNSLGFPSPLGPLGGAGALGFPPSLGVQRSMAVQQRTNIPTTQELPRQGGVQFSRLGSIHIPSGVGVGSVPVRGRGMAKVEGPPLRGGEGLLASLNLSGPSNRSGMISSSQHTEASILGIGRGGMVGQASVLLEGTATEMSLHALYLHELHHQRMRPRTYGAMNLSPSTTDNSPSTVPRELVARPTRNAAPIAAQPQQMASSRTEQASFSEETGEEQAHPDDLWRLPDAGRDNGAYSASVPGDGGTGSRDSKGNQRDAAILRSEDVTPDDGAPIIFESA